MNMIQKAGLDPAFLFHISQELLQNFRLTTIYVERQREEIRNRREEYCILHPEKHFAGQLFDEPLELKRQKSYENIGGRVVRGFGEVINVDWILA